MRTCYFQCLYIISREGPKGQGVVIHGPMGGFWGFISGCNYGKMGRKYCSDPIKYQLVEIVVAFEHDPDGRFMIRFCNGEAFTYVSLPLSFINFSYFVAVN